MGDEAQNEQAVGPKLGGQILAAPRWLGRQVGVILKQGFAGDGLPVHSAVVVASAGFAIIFVTVLTALLEPGSGPAALLLDYGTGSPFPYPFTIQNLMHIMFWLGMGELYVRWRVARWENRFLANGYLPEDDQTILQANELGPIRRQVANKSDGENGFLPYLIDLCILQFQSSRSVDQAVSVLNSSLELISHRVDLRYSMIRYIVWAIPTIGFIGTVVGISGSLGGINPDNMQLGEITADLGVAFYTTILSLLLSAIMVFVLHVVQKKEEISVNRAGDYCLKNLINRLYVGG